jgi:hypothetical protein
MTARTWGEFSRLTPAEQIAEVRAILASWSRPEPPAIYLVEDQEFSERWGVTEELSTRRKIDERD